LSRFELPSIIRPIGSLDGLGGYPKNAPPVAPKGCVETSAYMNYRIGSRINGYFRL